MPYSPPERALSARNDRLFVRICVILLALVVGCSPAPPPGPSDDATAPPTTVPGISPAPSTAAPASQGPGPTPLPSPLPTVAPSGSPTTGPTATITLDAARGAALQAVIDERRRALRIPGMAVTVRLADGQTWTGVSGLAVVDPPRPVAPGTPFAIASITKTFVTALIMQLAEEGRLDLDDPLARFLPDFPRADAITLRMLLNHTSGVHNYFENPRYDREVFRKRRRVWTVDQILALVGRPYFRPGRSIHYSNTGFVLLGAVAEEVTGRPLPAELRRRFLDPLGLEDTVFQYAETTPPDAAHGHTLYAGTPIDWTDGTRRIPNTSAVTVAWAAGAMAASAPDLATWAGALYGGRLVSPESVAQMTDFRLYRDYGLGTRSHVFGRRFAVGHTGGIRGFSTAMWHLPREGVTVVVLTNLGFVDPNRLTRDVLRALFRGVARPSVDGSPVPTPVATP